MAKPVTFKKELIKQILAGRKTQTRRFRELGKVGDRLYLKETVYKDVKYPFIIYYSKPENVVTKAIPSRYMRKDYARVIIEITRSEEQQLNEMTLEDAIAEGFAGDFLDVVEGMGVDLKSIEEQQFSKINDYSALMKFIKYWDKMYIKQQDKLWISNPKIWVTEFKLITSCAI